MKETQSNKTISNEEDLVFKIKKIEFERVFGHLRSLNESVTIGAAVEVFILSIIITAIIAVLDNKIPEELHLFNLQIPTLFLLGSSFLSGILALFFTLWILFHTVDDPVTNSEENPARWLREYITNATNEKEWRHKLWKCALSCLILTIGLFFVTIIMIILIN